MIKEFVKKSAPAIALLLASAAPALSSTLLDFSIANTSSATVMGSGTGEYLSSATLNFTAIVAGSSTTVSGVISETGTTASDTYTVTLNSGQTYDGVNGSTLFSFMTGPATFSTAVGGGQTIVTYGGVTSLSIPVGNTTFKSDVGVTTAGAVGTISNGDAFEFTAGSSGAVSSSVLGVTISNTPEPASFVLFGTGLIGLATVVRLRRRSAKASLNSAA